MEEIVVSREPGRERQGERQKEGREREGERERGRPRGLADDLLLSSYPPLLPSLFPFY